MWRCTYTVDGTIAKFRIILLLLIILISFIPLSTIIYTYDGQDLNNYLNMNLKIYILERIHGSREIEGIISLDEYRDRLNHILYLISKDPYGIAQNLSLTGFAKYLDENIMIYKGTYKGHKIIVALGDLGHFMIKIDNGETGAYSICNLTEDILRVTHVILYRDMEFKYSGQYAEQTAVSRIGRICNITNGTTTCYTPSTSEITESLINPYEIYYFYIDGIRIEPPLRIRCSIPKFNDGFQAVYVEGFIPHKISNVINITLTSKRISDIVDLLKQEDIDISSPDELVVEDTYLVLIPGQRLIPVFKLRYQNIVAWIGLNDNETILLSIASFTGNGSMNTGDQGLRIDWNYILANASFDKTSTRSLLENSFTLTIMAIIVVIFSIIYIVSKRRSRH